jgi:hypothetical protein
MTKTAAEVIAVCKQMKGEPAPERIYDETGIAHRAILARARRRWHEWNGSEPHPIDDEIPY